MRFRPAGDAARWLAAAGYSPQELTILQDFGEDFFGGVYRQYAIRFGSHLVQLVNEPDQSSPRARISRDGASTLVAVAARDYRGLAASITGALWHQGIDVQQAHVFSATRYGLAFDFFHIAATDQPLPPGLTATIEDAIRRRLHIGESDAADLPQIAADFSLQRWRPDFYCLRCEGRGDVGGLVYALAYRVFRHLRANIFGLTVYQARGGVFASVYHTLPPELSLEQARAIVAQRF
jgi:hypothetical protein